MSKEDFRAGLNLATDGAVVYRMRSSGENKGRMVFDGLTKSSGAPPRDHRGNVIDFPKMG